MCTDELHSESMYPKARTITRIKIRSMDRNS